MLHIDERSSHQMMIELTIFDDHKDVQTRMKTIGSKFDRSNIFLPNPNKHKQFHVDSLD